MTISVFFYVQHLLGVGHLARASLIAEALVARGATIKFAMGGAPIPGFPGPMVEVLELPSVSAGPGGFSDLVGIDGQAVDDDFRQRRREILTGSFASSKPDILLIEAFPFGRRQMRFELLPLLELALEQEQQPLIACSVRDILQERSAGKMRETVDLIASYFDLVLVHADPEFTTLERTFPLAGEFASKTHYTGVVSAGPGVLHGQAFDVVVSAGGGIAGERLLRAAVAARKICNFSNAQWCILTGPNLDRHIAADLQSSSEPGISFFESRPDFRALLANAAISVSQAGYNTAADILRAGCNSVMVPYASNGETEQTTRAGELANRGLVSMLSEDDLTAESLARAIDERSQMPPIGNSHSIDLNGADNAARILIEQATMALERPQSAR